MLRLLLTLVLFARDGVARVQTLMELPLGAPARLAWDKERVAAFRQGEQAAFADLYHAYAGLLYARVVLPLLRSPAWAEDTLADTFVIAHGRLRTVVVEDRSVFFWLATVARNRALDGLRRQQLERQQASKLEQAVTKLLPPEPDPESALSAAAESAALGLRIEAGLATLHPRYGRALRLRFLEERSREQCAAELSVSVPTFDVVLLRSLRSLRRALLQSRQP